MSEQNGETSKNFTVYFSETDPTFSHKQYVQRWIKDCGINKSPQVLSLRDKKTTTV